MESTSPRQVGSGWITGTLSVVLAAVGLFAVLCFRYPSLLALPAIRVDYPLPVIPAMLHLLLLVAFVSLLLSVILPIIKHLVLVAMCC